MQFKKYNTTHGLSDNVITAISQDDEGYLWIGTSNGLNRFDGTKFQNYFQSQRPINLPGNYVSKLIRLSDGCMGVITRRGFMKLNYTNYTGINYLLQDRSFFHTYLNSVNDAVELGNKKYSLKRVFFSAYLPVNSDSRLPALDVRPPLLREHRRIRCKSVRPEGFEPPTPRFEAWCSIQLSYGRAGDVSRSYTQPNRPQSG